MSKTAGNAPETGTSWDASLHSDYFHCYSIARHYENFPVASKLLPRPIRSHLAAIYAFARGADDIADEPNPTIGFRDVAPDKPARLAALDEWQAGLDGQAPEGAEPIFRALAATQESCGLSTQLFRDLITAFRWDVEHGGYESWDGLRTYADHSAAPIGRLVLAVAGRNREELYSASDDLCVALQYTNFWQDLSLDWPRGRLYLPLEFWQRPGLDRGVLETHCNAQVLAAPPLDTAATTALAEGLEEAVKRTEELFERSRDLPERTGEPLVFYLAAVWEGGHRILDRVRRLGGRAFEQRPSLGWRGRAATLWSAYRRVRAK